MTILYSSPIFGPVQSRRLGVSLGVNLMPAEGKVCTFDCIYCECGLNDERRTRQSRPTREAVRIELRKVLKERHDNNEALDVITFAGNGEPTAHPDFLNIIKDTIEARDEFFPNAKVSVLSNATMLHNSDVIEALKMVDNNIQKLDTVNMDYIRKVDRPVSASYNVDKVIEQLKSFEGKVIIQTIFMRGEGVDNCKDEFIQPWLNAIKEIAPSQVMIYTIDRETPVQGLLKAEPAFLDNLKQHIINNGIQCSASY